MFHGRWDYWIRTIDARKPLDEPIPQIQFEAHPRNEATKNITDCIQIIQAKGHGANEAWCSFIDWLLWGFGSDLLKDFPDRIDEDASWRLYTTFNLGVMMQTPADYMAWGSTELAVMKAGGYFPTPMNVCIMMAATQMTGRDKTSKTIDPCVGTGSMLLAASNYSLRLYGQDINLNMVKMCHVNGFIFVPWLVAPGDKWIDWKSQADYRKAIEVFEAWQTEIINPVPLITHHPPSNTLNDWI
jgi:hypothetical protein